MVKKKCYLFEKITSLHFYKPQDLYCTLDIPEHDPPPVIIIIKHLLESIGISVDFVVISTNSGDDSGYCNEDTNIDLIVK